MTTTIQVFVQTADLLKERKQQLGLSSLDAVINHLLRHQLAPRDDDVVAGGRQKRSRAPQEDVVEERVPQLLSYAALRSEPKALKWFTGLKTPELNWVVKALSAAVRSLSGDFFLSLLCPARLVSAKDFGDFRLNICPSL
jgi:hypothetical protein